MATRSSILVRAQPVASAIASLLVACLVVLGCSTKTRTGDELGHDASAAGLTATQRLDLAAAREQFAPLEPRPAPIPPGVEPAALKPRDPADPRAWMTLEQALAALAVTGSPAEAAEAAPVDPAARAAALRGYAAGRQAALDGRHLVAITELRRAAELDPASPEILRELARSYQAMRNSSAAAATYAKLVQLAPQDGDGALALALHAANQREAEQAAAALASVFVDGEKFDEGNGADVIALYLLSQCLRELDYDRASIEAARSLLTAELRPLVDAEHHDRLASIYRQRGELWRGAGDAHCRLGEYQQALEAYRSAASLPTADAAALPPRVLYANLRMGHVAQAKRELLASLQSHAAALSDHDVRLCAYMGEIGGRGGLLAEAVAAMYRASPDDQTLACTAAALLADDEAVALLREFVQRRPNDRAALSQLFTQLDRRDPAVPVELAISLAEAYPEHAATYAQLLAVSVARPAASLRVIPSDPGSPAAALVRIVLLESLNADGAAWDAAGLAAQRWPGDRRFLRLQLELAARLQEPLLVQELLIAVADEDEDARTLAAAALALQATGQSDPLDELARRAAERGADDSRVQLALAKLHRARAIEAGDERARRAAADEAVACAERAVALDPSLQDAFEVLLTLYQEEGLLADPKLLLQTVRRLEAAAPEGRLLGLLKAQDALARQREAQALELALRLYVADATHVEALELAVEVWQKLGRLEAARQWLEERLVERPGNPVLLEQWTTVAAALHHENEAIERLRLVVHDEPENLVAAQLLEQLLRQVDQLDEATTLGERRLATRPVGVRREMELAAIYAAGQRTSAALEHLRWIADATGQASLQHHLGALAILERMPVDADGVDAMRLLIAERTIERFPQTPLAVYGVAMESLARQDEIDSQLDALVALALQRSAEAADRSKDGALRWRYLAQRLVDAGRPAAAARVLRARLAAKPFLEGLSWTVLANAVFAADAAAGGQAGQSLALLRQFADQGRLDQLWPRTEPSPSLAEAIYQISLTYGSLGDDDGVALLLDEALRLEPDHVMALNNRGYTRIEKGENDPAIAAMIERAYRLEPRSESIADTLGWLRYKQGRWQDDADAAGGVVPGAVSLLRRSVELGEEPVAEVYDHLGDALWRSGDRDGAVNAWNRALSVLEDPAHRRQRVEIARLVQMQLWHLVVIDAETSYDREFGPLLQRLREKLRAVEQGERPPVAATFAELAENHDGVTR